MGLRETKMAFLALAAVRSFVLRSPRFLGFSAVPNGPGYCWAGRDWRTNRDSTFRYDPVIYSNIILKSSSKIYELSNFIAQFSLDFAARWSVYSAAPSAYSSLTLLGFGVSQTN